MKVTYEKEQTVELLLAAEAGRKKKVLGQPRPHPGKKGLDRKELTNAVSRSEKKVQARGTGEL